MAGPNSTGFSPIPSLKKMDNNSYFDLPPGSYSQGQLSAPQLQAQMPAYDNTGIEKTNMGFGGMALAPEPAPQVAPQLPTGPMNQFGGVAPYSQQNPYATGYQGPAPTDNPYFQPLPTTVNGQEPYDPLQVITNRQRFYDVQNANALANAQARDRSPLGYLNRFAAGFSGRPVVTNTQRALQAIGAAKSLQQQEIGNELKAIGMYQMSPQDYAKAMGEMAQQYNAGANNYGTNLNAFLGHRNTDLANQETARHQQSADRQQALLNQNTIQNGAATSMLNNRKQAYAETSGNRDYALKVQQQEDARAQAMQNFLWDQRKAAAEQGASNGTVYSKYNFPIAGPPSPDEQPEQNPIGNFLSGIGSALSGKTNAWGQPAQASVSPAGSPTDQPQITREQALAELARRRRKSGS